MDAPTSLLEAERFIARVKAQAGAGAAEPPEAPLPASCCERGCERCVFSVYYDALVDWARGALSKT